MRICECPLLVRRATLSPIAKGKVPADGKITQICRGWPKQAPLCEAEERKLDADFADYADF
jgi:hypothetical protein